MSECLTVFLASALAVAVLQPLPAFSQTGCDPNTSYCGGSTTNGQQTGLPLPGLQNGLPGAASQNPYGTGGGGYGSGINITGGAASMDLQQVPNYSDNLGGRGGGPNAGLYLSITSDSSPRPSRANSNGWCSRPWARCFPF